MERGLSRGAVEEPVVVRAGELQRRAEQLAGLYQDLLAAAEGAAVRWRWATPTSGHGDVEPLRLERMGCAPGPWLHRPPPPWQEHGARGSATCTRAGGSCAWRRTRATRAAGWSPSSSWWSTATTGASRGSTRSGR